MIPFFKGVILTAGLIISLGPQNIELVRLGLRKQNTFVLASVFIFCDIILVFSGAMGIGGIMVSQTELLFASRYIAAFMLYYFAYQAMRRFKHPEILDFSYQTPNQRIIKLIRRGLILSLFNPLVLLETVIIVGGASAEYPLDQRMYFILGSLSASFVWFYSIALGANKCSALFLEQNSQRILEGVGCLLLVIMATMILWS